MTIQPRRAARDFGIITLLTFHAGWASGVSGRGHKCGFAAGNIGTDQLPAVSVAPLPTAEAQRATFVQEQFRPTIPGIVQRTPDVLFRDVSLRPDLAPRSCKTAITRPGGSLGQLLPDAAFELAPLEVSIGRLAAEPSLQLRILTLLQAGVPRPRAEATPRQHETS